MKPLKTQSKVINSEVRCTFFGLTAGSGKTTTLLELSKRYLQQKDRKILFPISYRTLESHNLWDFYESLGCSISKVNGEITSPSGSIMYTKHIPPMHYDFCLLDNANNLKEEDFNTYIQTSSKSFVAMNCPAMDGDKNKHWFAKYLKPFSINGFPSKVKAGSKELLGFLDYTVIPMSVFENPYIQDEYVDCLYNCEESTRNRLLLGYFKEAL